MKLIITQREHALLKNLPEDKKPHAILNLRFDMWLRYNNLNPDKLTRSRMRQAYVAGFAMGAAKPSLLQKLNGLFFNVKLK